MEKNNQQKHRAKQKNDKLNVKQKQQIKCSTKQQTPLKDVMPDINNGILHDQFVQKQNHIIFCGFFEYFKA